MRDIQRVSQLATKSGWEPLIVGPGSQMANPVTAVTEWVLHVIDETEHDRHLPQTGFDLTVQEKYRRAS